MWPVGNIRLPVTFGTHDNFRTETIQFDVAKVNLPFNAIVGRPALYRFMASRCGRSLRSSLWRGRTSFGRRSKSS